MKVTILQRRGHPTASGWRSTTMIHQRHQHNGRELFYINGDKTMAVDVETRPSFRAGSPHLLFTGRYQPSPNGVSGYAVSPDGKRFLKVQPTSPEQAGSQINVVINWLQELKQRQPAR